MSGCETSFLVLTILPSSSTTTTTSTCASYTWAENGQTYTQSGTYTSVTGCDTSVLNLTILPTLLDTTAIAACNSYTWAENGQTYTQSGTYTSVSGCNTAVLVLTVKTSEIDTTTTSACSSYTWPVNGQTYTQSGTYSWAGTNAAGCDSTIVLVLTINGLPTASISGQLTSCDVITLTASGGTSYAWSGGESAGSATNRFATSGTYTVTVTSANGCTASTSATVTRVPSNVPVPTIVSIVQPSCQPLIDGKCGLSGLPAGNWTLMQLGSVTKTITGTGSTYTVDQLSDGVYRFMVIDQDGCPSPPTSLFGAIIRTY